MSLIESLKSHIIYKYKKSVWLQPNTINLTIFPKIPSKDTLDNITSYVEEILQDKQGSLELYVHCDSLEIVPKSINKGIAFKKILEIEGIKKEEAIAVGDGENDIPMLNEAGCSIGINLPQATNNFTTIAKAMDFILTKTMIDHHTRKEDLLKKLEYEQLCNDWRHRDAMLWSVLVIAITLAGVVLGILEKNLRTEDKLLIYLLALIFNIAAIVKITKDHYYQLGPTELMNKIFPNLDKTLTIDDSPRIHKPTIDFIKKHKDRIPLFSVYTYIATGSQGCKNENKNGQSAFRLFFIIQMGLIVIMFALIITTIMSFI